MLNGSSGSRGRKVSVVRLRSCSRKTSPVAYVEPAHGLPGTELEVAILGQRCAATVVEGPLYDPKNTRLRA